MAGYWKPNEFPYESFVHSAVVAHLEGLGFVGADCCLDFGSTRGLGIQRNAANFGTAKNQAFGLRVGRGFLADTRGWPS